MAQPNQSQFSDTARAAEVRRLDEGTVNRIAAGEVIERPASVIKELIENSIDAGASRVDVMIACGGKTLIRVEDDGFGMSRDNLSLAIERHCTSKITDDLLDIKSLGFRGEALPSIGSIARLSITSKSASQEDAWKIEVHGGKITPAKPAALAKGTIVEVMDLFYATPARLKFLKSDTAESNAVSDVFKRIALAFPQIRFSLNGPDRSALEYPACDQATRIQQVLGKEFSENWLEIDAQREHVSLYGFTSVPTYHRGNAQAQYFFVNGRPVKDKQLLGAVRGAYSDFLPSGRHPSLVLFIELEPHLVDVNVHPAKAEVRFRDAALIRGLIVGSLKQALSERGPLTSAAAAQSMAGSFYTNRPQQAQVSPEFQTWNQPLNPTSSHQHFAETQDSFAGVTAPSGSVIPPEAATGEASHPLGSARAQLHENYIVAQTETGLVIVDQHAAHERIVYEKLKAGFSNGMASQLLLVPEVVNLPEEDVLRLVEHAPAFQKLGLEFEQFGAGAIAVRGTPSLLGETDAQQLIKDLADEIAEWNSSDGLLEKLEEVAATVACHGSVRSGRILNGQEMNALLRQMENTPNSGQCNHGRPTFIKLDLKDIERLFGR